MILPVKTRTCTHSHTHTHIHTPMDTWTPTPAALQSVFPPTELGTFMVLSRADKQQHLVELTHIVTGIRLFNRESGKGGVGIDECEQEGMGIHPVCLSVSVMGDSACLSVYSAEYSEGSHPGHQ